MAFAETCQPLGGMGDGPLSRRLFHSLLQQFSQQPGDAGIPLRGLNTSPLSHVFFEGHGYVAEASGG